MTSEAARDPCMPALNPAMAVFLRRQLVRAVQSYRNDGRRLAELGAGALQKAFLDAFEGWVTDVPSADAVRTFNDVNGEYLLRRKPAPIELIVGRVVRVLPLGRFAPDAFLNREPVALIALGTWLFAPFIGGLILADDGGSVERTPRSRAEQRDFEAICAAVRGRPQ